MKQIWIPKKKRKKNVKQRHFCVQGPVSLSLSLSLSPQKIE
jgi:hypothetical protein